MDVPAVPATQCLSDAGGAYRLAIAEADALPYAWSERPFAILLALIPAPIRWLGDVLGRDDAAPHLATLERIAATSPRCHHAYSSALA